MELTASGAVYEIDSAGESATVLVDTAIHTPNALFRACYVFTDRCYLFLSEAGSHSVRVEFRKRKPNADLKHVAGTFANELINQRLRADLSRETKAIREQIVAQAFAEADFREPAV